MRTHRDLEAWKEARALSLLVLEAARDHWRPWAAALFAQLTRSSLSVQLNLAEGSTFGPSRTYTRHLGVAYGSVVETVELLELMVDADVLPRTIGQHLLVRANHAQQLLLGLLKRHRPMG